MLLEALALLRTGGLTLPLTIVGDGPDRPRLERCAAALELGGQVRFLGAMPPERVADALGDADVFAFPALGEGFGLAAAEALLAGVPVVAARDGGGVRDIVPEQGGGRLVTADARDIARAIGELVGDPDARRLAAAAGRRAAPPPRARRGSGPLRGPLPDRGAPTPRSGPCVGACGGPCSSPSRPSWHG